MKAEKQNYLIGICNTDADGVVQYRVIGTKRQVQRHLVALVKEDRRNDTDGYNYGTEELNDVTEDAEGCMQAYAAYSNYHIDYTATPEKDPIVLT